MKLIEAALAAATVGTAVVLAAPALVGATQDAIQAVEAVNTAVYTRVLMAELVDQPPTAQGLRAAADAVTEHPGIAGQVLVSGITGPQVTFEAVGRAMAPRFEFCVDVSIAGPC